MALTTKNLQPISAALGQYVTTKVSYQSDVMLAGEVLKLSVATFYDGSSPPSSPAFQILYPASVGIYDFANLGSKNYKAVLKVLNSNTFEIHFSFFITKSFGWDGCINSQALSTTSQNNEIAFYVKSDLGDNLTKQSVSINNNCSGVSFIESGFTPDVDLPIQIKINGSVSSNYYAALVRVDGISDSAPIFNGLFKGYTKVSNTIELVDNLDNSCFVSGFGFVQNLTESAANIVILGSALKNNGCYKLLVIYFQDGEWKSCLSDAIKQAATNAIIPITGTYLTTDNFGNTGQSNVSGVSNQSNLDFNFTVDEAAYLTANGFTFASKYKSVKAFYSQTPNAIGGFSIPIVKTANVFDITDFKNANSGIIYVIIQIEMDYVTHSDFINIPFKVNYNAQNTTIDVDVLDANSVEVDEICEGETYTIAPFPNCLLYESVNGSPYVEIPAINISTLPINSQACYKAICEDFVGGGGGVTTDCDCPNCPDLTVKIIVERADYNTNDWHGQIIGTLGYSTIVEGFLNTDVLFTNIGLGQPFIFPLTTITNLTTGCKYTSHPTVYYQFNKISIFQDVVFYGSGQESCDCDDVETVCDNKAAIIFNCNEDTQTITLNVSKTFTSTIEEEKFEITEDGVNYLPAPSSIVGASSLFAIYTAKFTDGCKIHVEQQINCIEKRNCNNSRVIDLITGATLVINVTDNFDAGLLQDKMKVSLNGGQTFTTYNPRSTYTPINLTGNEKIIVETKVVFDENCNDLVTIKTKDLNLTSGACVGYDLYTLTSSYNQTSGLFTTVKSGNELDLVVNELLWTLGGSNPFDDNKSGVAYNTSIKGEGLFIAAWKIKLPNCDEKIITSVAWGKQEIAVTLPPVQVTFPALPIEVCLVQCCDGVVLTVDCVNKVLTVTGQIAGSTLSWTGPNGFTATGNNVPILLEGTYFVTAVDNSQVPPCTSTGQYTFVEPNAGEPINNPTIIN